jgi:uncharacterized protein
VLIWPEESLPWAKNELNLLDVDDFAMLFALTPPLELLLVGTGPGMRFLPKVLQQGFASRGLPIEAMDSKAAARTYMVLLGEGRRVGALLLPFNP